MRIFTLQNRNPHAVQVKTGNQKCPHLAAACCRFGGQSTQTGFKHRPNTFYAGKIYAVRAINIKKVRGKASPCFSRGPRYLPGRNASAIPKKASTYTATPSRNCRQPCARKMPGCLRITNETGGITLRTEEVMSFKLKERGCIRQLVATEGAPGA